VRNYHSVKGPTFTSDDNQDDDASSTISLRDMIPGPQDRNVRGDLPKFPSDIGQPGAKKDDGVSVTRSTIRAPIGSTNPSFAEDKLSEMKEDLKDTLAVKSDYAMRLHAAEDRLQQAQQAVDRLQSELKQVNDKNRALDQQNQETAKKTLEYQRLWDAEMRAKDELASRIQSIEADLEAAKKKSEDSAHLLDHAHDGTKAGGQCCDHHAKYEHLKKQSKLIEMQLSEAKKDAEDSMRREEMLRDRLSSTTTELDRERQSALFSTSRGSNEQARIQLQLEQANRDLNREVEKRRQLEADLNDLKLVESSRRETETVCTVVSDVIGFGRFFNWMFLTSPCHNHCYFCSK
jgi:chromosome segregation ATPase